MKTKKLSQSRRERRECREEKILKFHRKGHEKLKTIFFIFSRISSLRSLRLCGEILWRSYLIPIAKLAQIY